METTYPRDAATRLLDALPRTEIVSVWALSNTYGRPRPELLADFRELRLGGRRHAAGALRAALAAASAALGEGASTTLTGLGTDGDRVEDEENGEQRATSEDGGAIGIHPRTRHLVPSRFR